MPSFSSLSMVAAEGVDMEVPAPDDYDAKCSLTIPIARPLAPKKLGKKLFKVAKSSSKVFIPPPYLLTFSIVFTMLLETDSSPSQYFCKSQPYADIEPICRGEKCKN